MTSGSSPDSDIDAVLHLLAARTGLSFRANQRPAVEQGIQRCLARAGVKNLAEYTELLRAKERALDDLIVELTVGETYFLREPKHFEYVSRSIIPDLQARRGIDHIFRMWCAGCASGEEAYSLAILCEQTGLAGRSHILATDISPAALAKAREAVYRPWSLRGEGAEQAKRFLDFDGRSYRLHDRIRGRVQFDFLNLALDVYPSVVTGTRGLDVIFCRNVLIYFNPETIRAVLRRLYDSLADGGWLILGSGDPPVRDCAPFELRVNESGIFYQKSHSGSVVHVKPAMPEPAAPVLAAPLTESSSEAAVAKADDAPADPLGAARQALEGGEYRRAAELTEGLLSNREACILHVKAVANFDSRTAAGRCGEAVSRHPLCAELNYLHAVLLMEINDDGAAVAAARRAVYLDRSLAAAHYLLGSILQRRGELTAARRAFRNSAKLCAARPADVRVPLTDDETCGQLLQAAHVQLAAIDAAIEDAAGL